jgi:hypothetical protein
MDLFNPVIQKIDPAPSRTARAEMVPALPMSFVLSFIRVVMASLPCRLVVYRITA